MNNSSSSNSESILIDTIKNNLLASWGIIYIIAGSIGTILNLIVFTRRALWTLSPCIPYFFASSIATVPLMYVVVLSRIGIGLHVTPFYYISILCKLQDYIANVSISLIIWFMVGSCWDRYLSSSRNALMRRMSSMRNTYRSIFIITVCVSLAYAQVFYCFEGGLISSVAPCSPKNSPCSVIDTTFLLFIQFIAPSLFIFYFGINIFLNIRQLKHLRQITNSSVTQQREIQNHHHEADRAILRMLIIQVTLLLICTLPTMIFRLYTTITMTTVKSNVRRSVENLIFNIALMLFYFEKVFFFYIHTITSPYFRKILWQFITTIRPHHAVAPQN